MNEPTLTDAADRDAVAAIVRAHRFGRGTGGTATGSRCACSCGEENYINSTRDMAERRAERHVADAILTSGWLAALLGDAVDRERAKHPRVELQANGAQPATCQVYFGDEMVFSGVAMSALLAADDTEGKP